MNPFISTLAQIAIFMPANFALRLFDLAMPLPAGALKTNGRRGEFLLCSLVVTGWWVAIAQTVGGIIGLP